MISSIDSLYNMLNSSSFYLLSFLVIMSIIVFVHEYGHYIVAKLCNVQIEVFSIGFGPELFGINDKSGTRWKFSLIPLGGYVKMLGDDDMSSTTACSSNLTEDKKLYAFCEKSLLQKSLIAFAGPFANIIFSLVLLTAFFNIQGVLRHNSTIGAVIENSAAAHAGLVAGDVILEINGYQVKWFEQVKEYIEKYVENNQELAIKYSHNGDIYTVKVKPTLKKEEEISNNTKAKPFLGIAMSNIPSNYELQKLTLGNALIQSINYTYLLSKSIFQVLGKILTGKLSLTELGGPIRIAQYSGESVKQNQVLLCMAMISINLGIMNLLPIPMLDGGHIFQYLIQAILRHKEVNTKYQRYAATLGLMLLLSLMIFVTFNDVRNIFK